MVVEVQLADGLYVRTRLQKVELALLLLVRLQNHKRDFTTLTIAKIDRHASRSIDEGTVRAAWESYKGIRGEGDNAIIFNNLRRDINYMRSDPEVKRVISEEETILQSLMRTDSVQVSGFIPVAK
ncbi:hypothetical protein TWF192_005756 [Orbilia oligospora]|uniref:Uncharacterized protein n=1 Tax=Orbilia oligospora TaxID=2813651 RepID=A0A6G1MMP8_ORBOL|nr:hypothetical protein TWF191_003884 [Orbilia oligospora]KAF3263475.1 hypothetical protein TWF192_005756 [Orbilia oligospora]